MLFTHIRSQLDGVRCLQKTDIFPTVNHDAIINKFVFCYNSFTLQESQVL